MSLFESLTKYVDQLDINSISLDRKVVLNQLVVAVQQQAKEGKPAQLNFICTHNSRRSHFAQIWAQTLAFHFNVSADCYSGGTEATAVFPKVIETLEKTGFEVEKLSHEANPVYAVKFDKDEEPILGFSKEIDHTVNPSSEFVAILTCSQADADCPIVFGANQRISLPYNDPKAFDETALQAEKYLETSNLIATELKFVFSQIN